jgi:hypothetical protein
MATNRKNGPQDGDEDTAPGVVHTTKKGKSAIEAAAERIGAAFANLTPEGIEDSWAYLYEFTHLTLGEEQSTMLQIAKPSEAALIGWIKRRMPGLKPLHAVPGAGIATVLGEHTAFKGYIAMLVPGAYVIRRGSGELIRLGPDEDHVWIATVDYGLEHPLRYTASRIQPVSFSTAQRKAWAERTTPLLDESDLFAAVRAALDHFGSPYVPPPRSDRRGPR